MIVALVHSPNSPQNAPAAIEIETAAEEDGAQSSSRLSRVPWAPQMLPPINEDCPLGDQSAQAFIDASSSGPAAPAGAVPAAGLPGGAPGANQQVDVWIHGWAAQVSELLGYFSREIARQVERMDQAEQKLSAAAEASAEQQSFKQLEAVTFTEALKMEREARMYETAQLRAALDAAGSSSIPSQSSATAKLAENLAEAAGAECDRFAKVAGSEWIQFSKAAASLREKLSAELMEQHARATLDIKEQHATSVQAIIAEYDARLCAVADLKKQLRHEVTEIASEAVEEVLEQQDRDRQFAELRAALQQASQDGTMPAANSNTANSKSDTRQRAGRDNAGYGGAMSTGGLSGGSGFADERMSSRGNAPVAPAATSVTVPTTGTAAAATAALTAAVAAMEAAARDTPSSTAREPGLVPVAGSSSSVQARVADTDRLFQDMKSYERLRALYPEAASAATAAAPTMGSIAPSMAPAIAPSSVVAATHGGTATLALRAEAAVRADLLGFMGVERERSAHFSGRRAVPQDTQVERFSSLTSFSSDQQTGASVRAVSPDRARSPTKASRLLPPPSMVLPPPSQALGG